MERTEIVNAKTKVEIEVPPQLTKSTRRKNAYHCVFAEACTRSLHVDEAIVHLSTAYLRFRGEKVFRRYRVQMRLRDQIVAFDKFGVFEPGIYTLSTIQPSHQARGERQGSDKPPKNGPKRRGGIKIKGVRERANIATL
jgi:hypothetical protein